MSPETVVTARKSNSGLSRTRANANASSMSLPMSVSSTMGIGRGLSAALRRIPLKSNAARRQIVVVGFVPHQSSLPNSTLLGSVTCLKLADFFFECPLKNFCTSTAVGIAG